MPPHIFIYLFMPDEAGFLSEIENEASQRQQQMMFTHAALYSYTWTYHALLLLTNCYTLGSINIEYNKVPSGHLHGVEITKVEEPPRQNQLT